MLSTLERQLLETITKPLNINVLEELDNVNVDPHIELDGIIDIMFPTEEHDKFCLGAITIIPGVRYTSNGDGWPDEVEIAELSEHPNFFEAFMTAVNHVIAYRGAQQTYDSLGEEAELRDMSMD